MELKEFCLKTIIKYDIKCPKNLMHVNSKKIDKMRKNLEFLLYYTFEYISVKFSFNDRIVVKITIKNKYSTGFLNFYLKNIYPYEACSARSHYDRPLDVNKYDIVECYKDEVIEKIIELYNNGIFKFTISLLSNECK